GVSAISSLWYGEGSSTDKRFPMLLEEAQKLEMRVFICYEEKINFPNYRHPKNREEVVASARKDLAYVLHNYGQHPAYLRRNGLPVIQQFNGYGETDVGSRKLTPEEFKQVFAALPTRVAYVRQNLDEAYHP